MGDSIEFGKANRHNLGGNWSHYSKYKDHLYKNLGYKKPSFWKTLRWNRIFSCLFLLGLFIFIFFSLYLVNTGVGEISFKSPITIVNFITGAVEAPF